MSSLQKCFTIRFLVLLAILCMWSSQIHAQSASENIPSQIVLLGTGTPVADPDRSGPCVAVIVNNTSYIIDCGPGLVRRAAAAAKNGIESLKPSNLKTLFITHLHSDHTLGYPDLIFSPWVLDRMEPLEVYGPEGTSHMTEHLLAAYERDIYMRLYGLEPANSNGYKVNVHEFKAGLIYQDANITVEAFPVQHGSFHYAYGFKLTTPDKIIVISGDTVPCDSLLEAAKGCDVLIHEVYCQAAYDKRAPEWKLYHKHFHTSTVELAGIAEKVKPKLLILYHQLFWGASAQDLLDEIKQHYDGRMVSGKDLDVFE
jgi:ribonuclease BN (tRNA processing enzyme)